MSVYHDIDKDGDQDFDDIDEFVSLLKDLPIPVSASSSATAGAFLDSAIRDVAVFAHTTLDPFDRHLRTGDSRFERAVAVALAEGRFGGGHAPHRLASEDRTAVRDARRIVLAITSNGAGFRADPRRRGSGRSLVARSELAGTAERETGTRSAAGRAATVPSNNRTLARTG